MPRIADIGVRVERTALPSEPAHFETHCGFKAIGAPVLGVVVGDLRLESQSDHEVQIDTHGERGGNVLLVLGDGLGVALPALREFITTVTVEDGEIAAVSYEPSEGSWRWDKFLERANEVRALRAVAASSADYGVFEFDRRDAIKVARRMQYAKGIDPALAVYASYAYAEQGHRKLIREMEDLMAMDLGGALFDVALLARRRDREDDWFRGEPFGFAPLLAQGWALLGANRRSVPPWMRELERHVPPDSLWTAYDPDGVEMIRHAFAGGVVR